MNAPSLPEVTSLAVALLAAVVTACSPPTALMTVPTSMPSPASIAPTTMPIVRDPTLAMSLSTPSSLS